MDLNIPSQDRPAETSVMTSPRKVKRWLEELRLTDLRETARQFFTGLRDCNRLLMPAKQRYEIMELLRPTARMILDHFGKRYLSLSLPLPERLQRVSDLHHRFIDELAFGYKIVIADDVGGNSKVSEKLFARATERAMFYLSERLLRTTQMYHVPPPLLWKDLHSLYLVAEQRGLLTLMVPNGELAVVGQYTIADAFRRTLAFGLARPETLGRADAERVFEVLEQWASSVSISERGGPRPKTPFRVNLSIDQGPTYREYVYTRAGTDLRAVDLSPLKDLVNDALAEAQEHEKSSVGQNQLTSIALRRLLLNWSKRAKRRWVRTEVQHAVLVAVGLREIHLGISDELEFIDDEENDALRLSLQGLPMEARERTISRHDSNYYINHPHAVGEVENCAHWDVLPGDSPLTQIYKAELHRRNPLLKRSTEATEGWSIVDSSEGGFALHCDCDPSSKPHIGEAIAIRDLHAGDLGTWRVGVVRWLRFHDDNTFSLGAETLSDNGIAILAEQPGSINDAPDQQCLLLPNQHADQEGANLLAPAHMYSTGDAITLRLLDRDVSVELRSLLEETGSFVLLDVQTSEISSTDDTLPVESEPEPSDPTDDDLDSVWSSL